MGVGWGWADDPAWLLKDPGSHSEPTMLLKRNIIFHEGLEIFTLPYHVVNRLLSVSEMVPGVTLQLISQSSEQAIAVETEMLVRVFQS